MMGMPKFSFYVNVSQTVAICTAAVAVVSYIFDFKGFRRDLNDTVIRASGNGRQ